MKNKNKILSIISGVLVMTSLSSCIKNRLSNETDFSGLQDHALIIKGGLTNFGQANVGFPGGDTTTVTLIVNLASVNPPKSPVAITIGVDAPKVDEYNSSTGKSFQLAPTNAYSIGTTTLTVAAGQQYAQTTVSFYKPALDPALSYLLPISITDASGKALTGNLNTIYYNIIGNPLAGNYSDVGYLYHPSAPRAIAPNTKTMIAISSTVLQVDLGDLGGAGYIAYLTVDPNTNVVTEFDPPGYYNADNNFLKEFNSLADATPPTYTAAWSGSAQCNNTYDPATKTFYLRYGYSGGGGYRVTEEILVKQ